MPPYNSGIYIKKECAAPKKGNRLSLFIFSFHSYWFATGTPTFLIDLFKASTYDIWDITEHAEMSRDSLSDYHPS